MDFFVISAGFWLFFHLLNLLSSLINCSIGLVVSIIGGSCSVDVHSLPEPCKTID